MKSHSSTRSKRRSHGKSASEAAFAAAAVRLAEEPRRLHRELA